MNPQSRIKRISNLSPTGKERGVIDARNFMRDHRDTIVKRKVPKGSQLIGIRALQNTKNDQVLHFVDFLIWTVPPNWPYGQEQANPQPYSIFQKKLTAPITRKLTVKDQSPAAKLIRFKSQSKISVGEL